MLLCHAESCQIVLSYCVNCIALVILYVKQFCIMFYLGHRIAYKMLDLYLFSIVCLYSDFNLLMFLMPYVSEQDVKARFIRSTIYRAPLAESVSLCFRMSCEHIAIVSIAAACNPFIQSSSLGKPTVVLICRSISRKLWKESSEVASNSRIPKTTRRNPPGSIRGSTQVERIKLRKR